MAGPSDGNDGIIRNTIASRLDLNSLHYLWYTCSVAHSFHLNECYLHGLGFSLGGKKRARRKNE